MKFSHLVYGAAGYLLGTRAGRERYDQIVASARRFAGSQTVQATAGVLQAQLDQATAHARQALAATLGGHPQPASTGQHVGTNGHRPT